MNRRRFLAAAVGGVGAAMAAPSPVQISVDLSQKLPPIAEDFIGLGYEISSVAIADLLSARNESYVQLVRTLSPTGCVRIGGNTSDYASYAPNGPSVSDPKETVVSKSDLAKLATFLDATGWKLIWGLNLGSNDQQQVVDEASAVSAVMGNKLLAFEMGNEPDLFGYKSVHRHAGYQYSDYLREFRQYREAVRQKLPGASFAGPDVAGATDWVTKFAADEGRDSKLLTHHYYRQCAGATSTLSKLMFPDPKLAPMLTALKAASETAKTPYRICEANSFCGGGQPGVSDSFGAALWALDFMFTLAANGCAGVNMETGVNQLGLVSSYSPITGDGTAAFTAKPVYYGMLAFAQAGKGQPVSTVCEAKGINLTAYAAADGGNVSLTIINKDQFSDANVSFSGLTNAVTRAIRLSGDALQSKQGTRLGGVPVRADGRWQPAMIEPVTTVQGHGSISVPAASAAILFNRPR